MNRKKESDRILELSNHAWDIAVVESSTARREKPHTRRELQVKLKTAKVFDEVLRGFAGGLRSKVSKRHIGYLR